MGLPAYCLNGLTTCWNGLAVPDDFQLTRSSSTCNSLQQGSCQLGESSQLIQSPSPALQPIVNRAKRVAGAAGMGVNDRRRGHGRKDPTDHKTVHLILMQKQT